MRTVIQALEELLARRLVQKGPLVLQEEEAGSTCPSTPIERTGQSIAIRFKPWELEGQTSKIPTNTWLFSLFEVGASPGISKSCDYIIFTASSDGSKVYVFLCELKSGSGRGKGRGRGITAQVNNGRVVAEHILNVVKLHGNLQHQFDVEFRALIFAGRASGLKGISRIPASVRYEIDETTNLKFLRLRAGDKYFLRAFCC